MGNKVVIGLLILGLLFVSFTVSTVFASGPATPELLIHIYANPDAEFLDFEKGITEVTDWPASMYWIRRWVAMPDIVMRQYYEIGMMQFDLNLQRWPTGWGEPKEYDPRTDTYKAYINYSHPRHWAAREFRKAIAHLTDKERYVREIHEGLAFPCETFVPYPALAGYTDYASLAEQGLIYEYSRQKAIDTLYNAGFRDWDDDDILEWRDPGETSPPFSWDDGNEGPIEELPELIFYIRMDDPHRRRAGELLADELTAVGLKVKKIITERTVCYRQVMVVYDFHIYTGGWSLGALPTWLHTIWNSEYYWAPWGWSTNYNGYCSHEYDEWSYKVYTASDVDTLKEAALKCQEIFAYDIGCIPLWTASAVKAFRSKFLGQVPNDIGYGVDNYEAFMMMDDTEDDVIDYGFKSDIEAIHVISSEWLWDWNAIGLIYESLMGRELYDKSAGAYTWWLGTNFTVQNWTDPDTGENYTQVNFVIRQGVTWQDGEPFTAEDVVFTYKFLFHCGKGIAWNFADVQYLHDAWVDPENSSIVHIQYSIYSPLLAPEWAGFLPIIPKHIWEWKFPNWEDWYDEETGEWAPEEERAVVRDWHPWEEDHPTVSGLTCAIGTGAWIFKSYVEGEAIHYEAYTGHYKTADDVRDEVYHQFWKGKGDANHNFVIDGEDVLLIHEAWLSQPGDPNWNPDCDFDGNGIVDHADHYKCLKNYGQPG